MPPSTWDDENVAAFDGLKIGDVGPLIELLLDADRPLHPELRLWLAAMLRGDTQATWILEPERHANFPKVNEADIKALHRWLVDSLKFDANVNWRLGPKRHAGFQTVDPASLSMRDLYVGMLIHKLWDGGSTIIEAKGQATERYRREERTIDDAWSRYRRIYFRFKEEGVDIAPGLCPLRPSKKPF